MTQTDRAAHGSRRAFVVVLDACGVGALPDAGEYGDAGTNTLAHLATSAVPMVGVISRLHHRGRIDVQHPGSTNREALSRTGALIDSLHSGLVFTNLI